ncbi:Protease IV [Lunatimonas lonarensis]|uniref:Protease IV n=1 Tax=Lunatimonas lonarensis TaxID=1232681 RepID=R7ZQ21_9BACT|nr:signal peptide peptidase SppA [Lunatimonas lonarensis]EON76231.1 Protease IV [Lunatimonas lonarensis]
MKFLSNVLSVIVGLFVFTILAFFFIAGLITLASSSEKVNVEENSLLSINLEGKSIVERTSDDEFDFSSIPGFGGTPTAGLIQLKRAIQLAGENDKIKGIYLRAGYPQAGQATLRELREALESFKESGKFIISYSEFYTEGGYYLSSVANQLYINPQGMLELNGLASEGMFFKGFFEKIGVEPQVFRVGDFKSAVEPFLLDKMSEESRLQSQAYLDELNQVIIAGVAYSRGIEQSKIAEISNRMLVKTPKDALEHKLVDGLWYDDQVMALLREKLEIDEDKEINTINVTNLNLASPSKNRLSRNRVAVLVAEGEIVGGNDDRFISSEAFIREIQKLKKNKDIKAVILRINSPGGSALASDVMWRELKELKEEKPFVVSMSDFAASGGYYMSAAADRIFAHPNTLTGSIGIFGIWFNAQELLNKKLGITTDVVKTGEFADFPSPFRTMRTDEEAIYQRIVEEGYDTFLSRVVDGRGMDRNEVEKIASGRVWSGVQAKEIGLVDELGGLDEAINWVTNKAEIADDFRVVFYPEQKSWIERLLSDISRDVEVTYQSYKTGIPVEFWKELEKIKRLEGVVARMPFFDQIR